MEPNEQPNGEDKKPRAPRADKGLPRRRSLLLSRAASARFVRVAEHLKGGEEELSELLEPWIDKLFAGALVEVGSGPGEFGLPLEDIALAAVAKRMKGGSDES